MEWESVLDVLDQRIDRCREPAVALRKLAFLLPVEGDLGYFYNDATQEFGLQVRGVTPLSQVKEAQAALVDAYGDKYVGILLEKEASDGTWVKLAYSPTIRGIGETLNFFPGTYPGGFPNHPSPLTAMLTSGALGAGIGYGGGRLVEQLMPEQYRGRLRKTTALLGGLGGASLAAPWMIANKMNGKSILDPSPHNVPIDGQVTTDIKNIPPYFENEPSQDEYQQELQQIGTELPEMLGVHGRRKMGSSFAGPFDVNVNALGQTLWRSGASPDVQAATMGAIYAAQSLPDDDAQEGIVTGNQLGQLAMSAGKGFIVGKLVGAALNAATGLPLQNAGLYGASLGIIQHVVPKLFQ